MIKKAALFIKVVLFITAVLTTNIKAGDKMEKFNSRNIAYEYKQVYNAKPETVFPLLCFHREYEWIDGWKCRMIHSESGYMEKGCIFISYIKAHHNSSLHDETKEMIWYVNTYDKEKYSLEATNFVNNVVLTFGIQLIDEGNGKTTAVFSRAYHGLNDEGNKFIDEELTKDNFIENQKFLEKSMNYFLENGKMLKLSDYKKE
jgi:hypothetical protein